MPAGAGTAERRPRRVETPGAPLDYRIQLPEEAVSLEQVHALFPRLRQSLLAKFDQCVLSTLFELRYANGWSTHPQARGILFHRFAAECLRVMQGLGEETIPVSEALEILYDVVRQRDVPIMERVRPSLKDLRELRISATKFAADNRFNVHRIVDIERRIDTTISYDHPDLGTVVRTITGQPDVLMYRPPSKPGDVHEAIVIDWKDTWGLPPERVEQPKRRRDGTPVEDDGAHVSYEGYFQQRFYALLVMHEYPLIEKVTLREFYPRKTKVREATVYRRDLEHIEREFAVLVEAFDATVAAGTNARPWTPQPGKHCSFCATPGRCPIEKEAKGEGAIRNPEQARQWAGEREVAWRVYRHRTDALKPWIETHGPIELKDAKGRRELGFQTTETKVTLKNGEVTTRTGNRFGSYVPDDSDRGGHPSDEKLAEALQASVDEARAARDSVKPPPKKTATPRKRGHLKRVK